MAIRVYLIHHMQQLPDAQFEGIIQNIGVHHTTETDMAEFLCMGVRVVKVVYF
jgi:hypothetical protein